MNSPGKYFLEITKKKNSSKFKEACSKAYTQYFEDHITDLRNNPDTKLSLFAKFKRNHKFETYLNYPSISRFITKLRLSDHNLPIERGRYTKPKTPRNLRTCSFCNIGVGDEFHVLFLCENPDIRTINMIAIKKITEISIQFSQLPKIDQFSYIFQAADLEIIHIISNWFKTIFNIFNKK